MTRMSRLSVLLYLACALSLPAVVAAQDADNTRESPRNVILIIGDGMDDHQITIARNYLKGAAGTLQLDAMPMRGAVQVLTIEDKVGGKPLYVADSANTASSIATGVVTSRGRISTTAGSDEPVPTIVELASAAGYRTGLVSTASVTDATPAAFASQINFRLCENPAVMHEVSYSDIPLGNCIDHLKANGGGGSIAEQLVESPLHVILGGGQKHFAPQAEGKSRSVLALAQDNGFATATSADQLQQADFNKKLLGLFAPSTLPVRMRGQNGREAESPEVSLLHQVHDYLGEVTLPEVMRCEPNPEFGNTPTLKAMTDTAIAHLSANNSRGFFLMVESASIDKASHQRRPCGSIGEVQQLEEALQSALDFSREQPNTLVIVTADHTQAAQLVPQESLYADFPIPIYTPGKIARIQTPEGSVMAVNYATNNFAMEEHTGANVPLFANEVGRDIIPPFIQQPQLFGIMTRHLGL
jgi:alkaline phosphatase